MSRARNPLVKGRMYKVTDGGSVKGIRFNKDGTTDVLVVPGSKRNPRKKPKKKPNRKRKANRKRSSNRKRPARRPNRKRAAKKKK